MKSNKTCKVCDYVATNNTYLNIHIESVHIGLKYKCDLCNVELSTNANLKRHKTKVHTAKAQITFKTKEYLKRHNKVVNDKIRKFPCKFCDKSSTTLANLKRHLRIIHGSEEYDCEDCSYSTESKRNLDSHRSAVHLKMKLKCKECHFESTYTSTLYTHIKQEHQNIKFKCDECDFQTSSSHTLKKHVISEHGDTRTCKECKKIFHKNRIKAHINLYHNKNVKYNECNLCDFKTKHRLKSHYDRVHLRKDVRKYSCSMCDTDDKEKSDLRKHIERVHMDKKLNCNVCDFKCSTNTILKNHNKTIHGEKRFSCSFCSYKTSITSHLKRHVRNKHKRDIK